MSSEYRIRVAERLDAESLGTVGPAIYAENYGNMWSDAGAYAEQLATFGVSAVAKFIGRRDSKMWLAEQGDRVVGFVSIVLGSPDPIDARTDGAEVPRIYILAPARGRGLGERLIAQAASYARSVGANHLWLDAMKQASWAWQTYMRWGFVESGETAFQGPMRQECKPMLVMRRSLD